MVSSRKEKKVMTKVEQVEVIKKKIKFEKDFLQALPYSTYLFLLFASFDQKESPLKHLKKIM